MVWGYLSCMGHGVNRWMFGLLVQILPYKKSAVNGICLDCAPGLGPFWYIARYLVFGVVGFLTLGCTEL